MAQTRGPQHPNAALTPAQRLKMVRLVVEDGWSVTAVVCVGGFGVEVVAVGDEAVVAPVGPQLALGAEQAAAAYDQAQIGGLGVGAAQLVAAAAGFDGGLSHLGLAAAGVGDGRPGVLDDGRGRCFDLGVLGDRDRVGRTVVWVPENVVVCAEQA